MSSPIRIWPLVVWVTIVTPDVPFPMRMAPVVRLVWPVPPFPTGRVPLTPVARATSFQAGLLSVPVFARYWVGVVLLASLAGVLAPLAYITSPWAVITAGAVTSRLSRRWVFKSAAKTT